MDLKSLNVSVRCEISSGSDESCYSSPSPDVVVPEGLSSHQVALEANEFHVGGDGMIKAPALGFNRVHQVSAELIASFQNTQNHQVIMNQVIQDISG